MAIERSQELEGDAVREIPDSDGSNRSDMDDQTVNHGDLAARTASFMTSGIGRSSQLTIFYSGTVNVYDGVSPEKAQALMLIAAAAAVQSNTLKTSSSGSGARSHLQSSPAAASQQAHLLASSCTPISKLQAELPIARRHSLVRFLEKRRDRLVGKSPYVTTKATEKQASTTVSGQLGCFSDAHTGVGDAPSLVAKSG